MSGRARQSGFTLAEVLAALALTAIVLPLAMHGLTVSMHAAAAARHQTEAAHLAEWKVNELLVLRETTQINSYGDFGEAWPEYRWQTRAEYWGDAVYEVTVTVLWQERGRERALSMATLLYTSATELEW